MTTKAKLIMGLFVILLAPSISLAGTFTGVTPDDLEACENRNQYDYCRIYNLLDSDDYTNDRLEAIAALRDYMVDTTSDRRESVDVKNIEKTKSGRANGATNSEKRTDYLVEFSHNKYYGSRTDCQVKLFRLEGSGNTLRVNENSLKCGEDLVKANFLEISKASVVSHIRNHGDLRQMIGSYVTEQKKVLDVLNEYFVSRYYDDDSIKMKSIVKTRSGAWHGDTKAKRISVFTVKFEHRDRSPYQYDDCRVQVRTQEMRGGPEENSYWVATGALSCKTISMSPY